MEPVYHVGSLVYVRPVEPDTLEEGEVITFSLTGNTMATHRIVEVIGSGEDIQFRTKGDANDIEDGSLVQASNVVGKVIFSIPFLGYAASFIQTAAGRAALIAYGAFLLLMLILPDLIFEDKKEKGVNE